MTRRHDAPGRGNPGQPAGQHRRQDQNFVKEGEQAWPVIQARLDAERLAASRERER